jgi:uncharacterized membrane protein YphA (DoxX/SURF4 family)
MNKNTLGIAVLRYGLAFVLIWFGTNQILHTGQWTAIMPAWIVAVSHMSASILVVINGICEIIGALMLIMNLWVPLFATLLALHMISIVVDLGLTAVGVRDVGLGAAFLALAILARKE